MPESLDFLRGICGGFSDRLGLATDSSSGVSSVVGGVSVCMVAFILMSRREFGLRIAMDVNGLNELWKGLLCLCPIAYHEHVVGLRNRSHGRCSISL